MNRRQLLAGSGVALGVAVAGCLDDSSLSSDPNGDDGSSNSEDSSGSNGNNDPTNGSEVVPEEPRTDEPPHEIDPPEPPEGGDEDEWNEKYLGEEMDTEPSVPFESIAVNQRWVRESALEDAAWDDGDSYHVQTVTDEETFEDVFDEEAMDDSATADDAREQLREVDFDDVALVLVESGFGSGSVGHRWARVEDEEGGVQLHGYYTAPYMQTDDIASRLSVLEIEHSSNELGLARVALTVSKDRRVHFNSSEDVVSLEE